MAIIISPLELILDNKNPRFISLGERNQAEIRRYLVINEDVCSLAMGINSYGGLLPGERIVVIQEDSQNKIVEGNRRTCALQMLLNRDLIPDGFQHRIPRVNKSVIESCTEIEVDVLESRDKALELMTKRHIEGVKQWRPLAKKQFFASNYAQGIPVNTLSSITGVKESEIKQDIKDFRFFIGVYNQYREKHDEYLDDLIDVKIDPFLRIFNTRFTYPAGNTLSPKDLLKISYDEEFNLRSGISQDIFNQIVELVFEATIVNKDANTRSKLNDINGIYPFLDLLLNSRTAEDGDEQSKETTAEVPNKVNESNGESDQETVKNEAEGSDSETIEQKSGGPAPYRFFESICWDGKLLPSVEDHAGLLCTLNELHRLSSLTINRKKAYHEFPVSTGMVLRSSYEQALRIQLLKTKLWGDLMKDQPRPPTLGIIEDFVKKNKEKCFPIHDQRSAFDRIINADHRDFLNANVHNPGRVRVTGSTLEGIAAAGMYYLIQSIIDQL